jgi:hypothetical protein
VLLKLIGAGLPLAALSGTSARRRRRVLWRLGQLEAVVLLGYGFVLTAAGLLVQAAVIHRSAHADSRALAWHAFVWDPWFLIWGLAVALALRPGTTARVQHD